MGEVFTGGGEFGGFLVGVGLEVVVAARLVIAHGGRVINLLPKEKKEMIKRKKRKVHKKP